MFAGLFQRRESKAVIERCYAEIVAAARQRAFFGAPFGVADTPEGRFELMVLHAFLALRRLATLPPPAPDFAQDLSNRIFNGFDDALREMGIGDTIVPKRMKKFAEQYGGRWAAYEKAMSANDASRVPRLQEALARNVYGRDDPASAAALTAYALAAAGAMDCAVFSAFERGPLPFPGAQASSGPH